MPRLLDAAADDPRNWRGGSITLSRRAAKKLLRFGRLQSLVRVWIEVEDARARKRPPDPSQPPLPFPSLLLLESDRIRCKMGCVMSVRACLLRRSRYECSGAGKLDPKYPECVGCPLGYDHAARCPSFTDPGQRMTGGMSRQQQRARVLALLSTPPDHGGMDRGRTRGD